MISDGNNTNFLKIGGMKKSFKKQKKSDFQAEFT